MRGSSSLLFQCSSVWPDGGYSIVGKCSGWVNRNECEFFSCFLLVLWPCTSNLNVLSLFLCLVISQGVGLSWRTSCIWSALCPTDCRTKLSEKIAWVESAWVWGSADYIHILPLLCDFGHISSHLRTLLSSSVTWG